jgi:hypothetical protein
MAPVNPASRPCWRGTGMMWRIDWVPDVSRKAAKGSTVFPPAPWRSAPQSPLPRVNAAPVGSRQPIPPRRRRQTRSPTHPGTAGSSRSSFHSKR